MLAAYAEAEQILSITWKLSSGNVTKTQNIFANGIVIFAEKSCMCVYECPFIDIL